MIRAVVDFALALLIGTTIGILVARITPLRLAVGSLITGLQTMPSIAWFPFAILLFGLNEQAILFVVVLGAAQHRQRRHHRHRPHPPSFMRLGHVLGAGTISLYRNIALPAALPGYVAGLTQGWAFAWRSLMAGELLVIIAEKPSLGASLKIARQFSKAPLLLATMLVILILGMLVDGLFSTYSPPHAPTPGPHHLTTRTQPAICMLSIDILLNRYCRGDCRRRPEEERCAHHHWPPRSPEPSSHCRFSPGLTGCSTAASWSTPSASEVDLSGSPG